MATLGIGTALTILSAAGRFIPGVGPFVQPFASLLANIHWFTLSSKDEKDAEARQVAMGAHLKTTAEALRAAAPDKMDALPPAVQAAIKALSG